MKLYIIRHAIAMDEGTPEYEHDSDRPLTDKGRKKMRQIARGLRALGVEFDLILSSPYIRASETADILADVFKMKKKIVFSENLIPMGEPDLLIAEINKSHAVDSLALVGHEPNLSSLVGLLTADDAKLDITIKKGGVCQLSTNDLHQVRHATLECLLTPDVLVKIGEK
jgi:phosphohistidine phosphatase